MNSKLNCLGMSNVLKQTQLLLLGRVIPSYTVNGVM